jgi:L-lactate dehydrogenase complex protein LldG
MTDSRNSILNKLSANAGDEWQRPNAIQPGFVMRTDSLLTLFKQKLEAVHTSVDLVRSSEQVGDSIANFLNAHNSPMEVGVLPGVDIDSISTEQGVTFYPCEDFAACHTVLTQAPFGIAETGSVVLPSSLQRPTLANFLPDNCIVILDEANIRPYMEDALSSVQNSDAGMPRALNLVSGPSKTADIEQTLVYGAHGPIQLHVIVRLTETL